MIALMAGHIDAVQMLLDAKVDLNLQDFRGHTALMLVASLNEVSLLKALIAAGRVDITIKDNTGRTALDIAKGGITKDTFEEALKKRGKN